MPTPSRQLIITADDFGLSKGVNKAVEKAWQEGILTCASIMAGGAAFDDAVAIARRNPGLQVGLHLSLIQGRPVLPPSQIPGLVNEAGCFSDNPVAAGMRFFFDKSLYKPILREIEAQWDSIERYLGNSREFWRWLLDRWAALPHADR